MQNEKKIKTLAVIGAGEGAMPILKRATQLDYVRTLVFGMTDSIARDLADEFVTADYHDVDTITDICRSHHVDGVMASSENTTEVTAIIAHRLRLPGNDITGGFAARNKYLMRCRVGKITTIRQPRYTLYSEGTDYQYPVVVKALDSCAKRGIKIAYSQSDMDEAVAYARQYSSDGRVLVEEYIEGGTEYSIECLAGNGLHEVIQITEYESYGPPHFVETAHHQPAKLSLDLKEKIVKGATDVLKVLGINYGMAHMEVKVVNGEVYFIEVGARAAGGHLADILLPASTDFDYFKEAIDCCLGQYVHKDVHNVAFSGIFFRCSKNAHMKPLFDMAKAGAPWCISYVENTEDFPEATDGEHCVGTGHFAYCMDHKMTMEFIQELKDKEQKRLK